MENVDDDSRRITDLDIQALVDGETGEEQGRVLMDIIHRSPILLGRYMLYKKQKDLLKLWFRGQEN